MVSQPDLYQFRSLFRSPRTVLSEADQGLIASLPQLALRVQPIDFASALLDLLRVHPDFRNVARVCLVRRLGMANQIAVISSCNLDKQPANSMVPGYSCFIGEKGSLFSLSPGTSRSYRSAATIVSDFQARGLPPQRSIQLIADMQFASGLVLPSFDHQERFIGALFFNSFDDQIFQRDADCTILAAIESYARSHILQQHTEWLHAYESLPLQWSAQSFSAKGLTENLHAIDPQLSLRIENQVSPFLISHGNLAALIHQILRHANSDSLRLKTDVAGASVVLVLEDLVLEGVDENQIDRLAKSVGYRLYSSTTPLKIEVIYEPVISDSVTYSTTFSQSELIPTGATDLASKDASRNEFKDNLETGADDDLMMVIVVNYLTGDLTSSTEDYACQHLAEQCLKVGICGISLYRAGIFMHILEGRRGSLRFLDLQWSSLSTFGSTRYLVVQSIDSKQFSAWQLQSISESSNQTDFVNEILGLNLSHKSSLAELSVKLAKNYFKKQV